MGHSPGPAPVRADAETSLIRPSRQAGGSLVPAQEADPWIFQETQGFSRKSSFFKDSTSWAGTKDPPACRLEGGWGSVGIGPQGRESVPRHSARAGGIIGIDSGGPERPQMSLNDFPEIFQPSLYFKKMTI